MNRILVGLPSLMLLFLISCTNPSTDLAPNTPNENKEGQQGKNTALVAITDEQGTIIPGARVLIGNQVSATNAWIGTNELGQIPVPKTWTTAQNVTIEAPNHVRLTLRQQKPGGLNINLKKKSQIPSMSIKGTVSGITTKDKDGFLDFAVLLDSMTKNDVLNFNVNKIISPYSEEISAMGIKFPTPQNIFLPKQTETYFLTVTIQKPAFTMSYDSYGTKSLYTLRGKIPVKKMISDLQNNKPYFELVNYFDFSSAGRLDYNFSAISPSPVVDAAQILLDKTFNVKAPSVAADQVIFGISAFKEKKFYQPMDVKYMLSNETLAFKTNLNTAPYFIGVLKNKNEFEGDNGQAERMSISIDTPKAQLHYLPLTKDPTWISRTELQVDLPSMVDSGFSEHGMVVVVSEMQNMTLPDGKTLKYKVPVWEVHSANWNSQIQLPDLDLSSGAKRVEVTLLARETDNSGQQNPVTLVSSHEERVETATHLTKSARDY